MPERLIFEGPFAKFDEWYCNCPFIVENDTLKRKWTFKEWLREKQEIS